MSGLTPIAGTLGIARAEHLLRRATFGYNWQQVVDFAGRNVDDAINQLFAALPDPTPPVNTAGVSWTATPPSATEDDEANQNNFKRWLLAQMLTGNFSTKEKITFFLHSHFTTIQSVVNQGRALYFQNVIQRMYAFDKTGLRNFKELTKKICIDNAMLILLDGRLNIRGKIQENFARELFELYSVGRGRNVQPPGPGDYVVFKQTDIEAAAKALTGYDFDRTYQNLDPDLNVPVGIVKLAGQIAVQHDNSIKQFSNYFGNAVITPNPTLLSGGQPTQASMLDELDQLINIIYSSVETAKNICRKIYRFFVYHNITDDIDNNIITPLANSFIAGGFRLQPIIETLLKSSHFYDSTNGTPDDDNFGALIKSPLDLLMGVLRLFNIAPTSFANADETYRMFIESLSDMGLNFYEPFDVSGYDAYHQEPMFNRAWISTNRLTNRYKFIEDLLRTDMMGGNNAFGFSINLIQYCERTISDPSNPNILVDEFVNIALPQTITTERRNYFKFVLNADLPDMNWTVEWSRRNNPGSAVPMQLQKFFNAVLQSPEYQLF